MDFYNKAGFPGVVGAIDCTHIRITQPSENSQDYLNRKSYYSINVQAICYFQWKFINIVAKWPGSVHDSWILQQSAIRQRFDNGIYTGILLGVLGYPCKPWLITPLREPTTEAKTNFNTAQKRTRVVIEQSFGIL